MWTETYTAGTMLIALKKTLGSAARLRDTAEGFLDT